MLDEVTASLDEQNSGLIEQLVLAEQQTKLLTILFITHNVDQARRLADSVLYLVKGRVAFHGPKDEYFSGTGGWA